MAKMTAIQLPKEYGVKTWLVALDDKPSPTGRHDVARARGINGETLKFDSQDEAEAFIAANPDWAKKFKK